MTVDRTKSDAAKVAEIRDLLPTSLGSAEIRDQIAADVRVRSVFVSRAANVVFLSKVKEVIDAVAAGKMDKVSARAILGETLRAIGYTPEEGFPDDESGEVPEAIAGTLQDISSQRRLNLIVNTQADLMGGRGQQLRGMETERFQQFPAWELIRVKQRTAPRNWGDTQEGSPPRHNGQADLRSRWTIAGGKFYDGRLIALKGDPVWGELGASENFDDALDTDHPPFAFNSGMGWQEIDRGECSALGVTGPDGETPDEWIASAPGVMATPAPVVSVRDAAPELVSAATESMPAAVVGPAMTTPENADALAARQATIRARGEDRLARAIARRQAEYDSRPK